MERRVISLLPFAEAVNSIAFSRELLNIYTKTLVERYHERCQVSFCSTKEQNNSLQNIGQYTKSEKNVLKGELHCGCIGLSLRA